MADKQTPAAAMTPRGRRLGGTRHQHSDGEYYPFPETRGPGVPPVDEPDGRPEPRFTDTPIDPDPELDGDA